VAKQDLKTHRSLRRFTPSTPYAAVNTPDNDNVICSFLNSDDIVSRGRLSDTFGIPPLFWTGLCQQASGFFWAKDEASQAASNHAPPNATYFRFLIKRGLPLAHRGSPEFIGYRWDLLGFTSHWSPQGGLVMLCFDVPSDLHERVGETLLAGGVAKYGQGPFSLHAMLMLLILESFDRAVWSWRDLVRNLEKTRVDYTSEQRTFGYMHEAARHVIHCSEMLATAMTVTESLVKEVSGHASHQGDPASSTIVGDLKFSISMLAGLRNRSQALEKRIENEINLASQLALDLILEGCAMLTCKILIGTPCGFSTRLSGDNPYRKACT
jgi:hypothetical protein